ncbi:site-2 protease family protein [Janibacter sp. G56]|uniref:site-2 protease family protein n=1 Tax=Janibacter sp. G56 TaxID=3418717 RepID=UPI003D007D74
MTTGPSSSSQAPSRAARASGPGWRIATIGGVPVHLGGTWFLMAAVIVALIGPGIARSRPDLGLLAYAVAFAYALLLLVAVLVHEGAHALATRAFGLPVLRVVADLWGGHTAYDPTKATAGQSAVIAVVGPISNLVLAGVAFVVAPLLPPGVPHGLAAAFALINGVLAAFNLLPGHPLDGGQLVESAVWGATGDRHRGRVVAGWCGRLVVVGLAVWWLVVPLLRGRDLDITQLIWVGMVGMFMWRGASQAIAAGTILGSLGRVPLTSVIQPAHAITADATVAQAADAAREGAVAVLVGPEGRPLGLVDAQALGAVPRAAWATTSIAAVVRHQPPEWALELGPDADAIALVRTMQEHDLAVVAVTTGGVLRGVATAQAVMTALDGH